MQDSRSAKAQNLTAANSRYTSDADKCMTYRQTYFSVQNFQIGLVNSLRRHGFCETYASQSRPKTGSLQASDHLQEPFDLGAQ